MFGPILMNVTFVYVVTSAMSPAMAKRVGSSLGLAPPSTYAQSMFLSLAIAMNTIIGIFISPIRSQIGPMLPLAP